MAVRTAEAEWKGDLRDGTGTLRTETGAVEGRYSFPSRFEDGGGTNPEELLAAAHAGCFSMALAAALSRAGHTPERVHTTAHVHLEKGESGFSINRIDLSTRVRAPGMGEEDFQEKAVGAKAGCIVSRALGAVEITLDAKLES